MWSDAWIADLDPIEKLLFLYLLTNERTNIAGIYELPLKIMAVETGIEKDMIEKILRRFEKDNKVIFMNNYIGIRNFIKHQDTASEKILKGINTILSTIPSDILDTLLIPYPYPPNYLNSNIIKYNSIATKVAKIPSKEELEKSELDKQIQTVINDFKDINPSYSTLFGRPPERKAAERLIKLYTLEGVREKIKAIIYYKDAPFCPVITKPTELENKVAKLESFLKRQ